MFRLQDFNAKNLDFFFPLVKFFLWPPEVSFTIFDF